MIEDTRGHGIVILSIRPTLVVFNIDPSNVPKSVKQVVNESIITTVVDGVVVQEVVRPRVPKRDTGVQGLPVRSVILLTTGGAVTTVGGSTVILPSLMELVGLTAETTDDPG